jgi:hypothetical protein
MPYRREVELGVAEQCQLDLTAESDDMRLVEEELVGSLPMEVLGSAIRQAKYVGPDVLHRV